MTSSRRLVALLALLVIAPHARANGRYPYSQQLVEQPGNPDRLWLRTTYGIVTSADRGKSWRWICENAAGYSGAIDPAIGVFSDGGIAVALADGLTISRDGGCTFDAVPELANRDIADVSVERNDASRGVALESRHLGGGAFSTRVHRTIDAGKSWQEIGAPLPSDFRGLTLDVAASDSSHLYVSGIVWAGTDAAASAGVLYESTGAGTNWTRRAVPSASAFSPPYIAAVHPTSAGTVYLRVHGYFDPESASGPVDRLLVSNDGGQSFSELMAKPARLLGVALSPDGTTVLAGFGDTFDQRSYELQSFGLYRAAVADHVFVRVREGHIGCLAWTGAGVYACTLETQAGFELGLAPEPSVAFTGLLRKSELTPLECPAGAPAAEACPQIWSQEVCAAVGACTDAGSSGAADGGAADAAPPMESTARGGGCGCRATNVRSEPALSIVVLSLLLVLRRARAGPHCAPRTLSSRARARGAATRR